MKKLRYLSSVQVDETLYTEPFARLLDTYDKFLVSDETMIAACPTEVFFKAMYVEDTYECDLMNLWNMTPAVRYAR